MKVDLNCLDCSKSFDSRSSLNKHKCLKKKVDPTILDSDSQLTVKGISLIQNVLKYGTYVGDEAIARAYELMRKDPSANKFHIGYYTPCEMDFKLNTMHPSSWATLHVPNDKCSIMIHYLSKHWVTSYWDPKTSSVYIYDSLANYAGHRREELLTQLKMLYGVENDNLQYMKVTQQASDPVCGVLAVAFGFSLLLGEKPELIKYNVTEVRQHLALCLSEEKMSSFPQIVKHHQLTISVGKFN